MVKNRGFYVFIYLFTVCSQNVFHFDIIFCQPELKSKSTTILFLWVLYVTNQTKCFSHRLSADIYNPNSKKVWML